MKKTLLKGINVIQNNFFELTNFELNGNLNGIIKLKLFRAKKYLSYLNGASVRGVDFGLEGIDPIMDAVRFLYDGESIERATTHIYNAYCNEKNKSAAEQLQLNSTHKLSNYPAWATVLPWEIDEIDNKLKTYPIALQRNRSVNGLNFENNNENTIIERSYSLDAASSQAKQYYRILNLVKNKELKINDSELPNALIYLSPNGKSWKWIMDKEGNHRAYTSFFCHKKIKVEVKSFINPRNIHAWPNVRNKLFTKEQALNIYEKMISGRCCVRPLI